MEELFRFMMLRPASLPPPDHVKTLTPAFTKHAESLAVARRKARQYVDDHSFVGLSFDLTFGAAAEAAMAAVRAGTHEATNVAESIRKAGGRTAAEITADERFKSEQSRLEDSLVAMKLLSRSAGGDAPGIERMIQGYDVIQQVADWRDPIVVRCLVYDLSVHAKDEPPAQPEPPPPGPPAQAPDHRISIARIDAAIAAFFIHGLFFAHDAEKLGLAVGSTAPAYRPTDAATIRSGKSWVRTAG
jgi:hypothetical protein